MFGQLKRILLTFFLNTYFNDFSSPKLSWNELSDFLLSITHLSVCKFFTFSFSSPELLGQCPPNLALRILWSKRFMFVHDQIKDIIPFQGGDNSDIVKIPCKLLRIFSRTGPISPKLAQLGYGDSSLFK